MPEPNKDAKSFNLQERQWAITQAFDEMFPPPPPPEPMPMDSMPDRPFVIEYYDDYIIVCENDKYYRAKVTAKGEKVEIAPRSEWVEAERKTEWVNAAKAYLQEHRPQDFALSLDDTLVTFGTAVKALGGGRVGGYLVRYGSENATDASPERDFFTPETDFDLELPGRSTVYFNHGLDPVLKRRKLAKATLESDEFGIWATTILNERDQYEKFLLELAGSGKLGWSSGTASHLVEREAVGEAHKITRWPLGLDASLTHIPAEPLNVAAPLKSIPVKSLDGLIHPKESIMEFDQTQFDTAVSTAVASALEPAIAKGIETALKALPAIDKAGVVSVTHDEADTPFASFGAQLAAVKRATLTQGRELEPRLKALNIKQLGANELLGSEGGFLLEPSFVEALLTPLHDSGPFTSRVARLSIGPNANGVTVRAVNETSRATGSRWGGIQGYWLNEAGTKTASQPDFRLMELRLKKIAVLMYATEELLQDTTALGGIIQQGASEEIDFLVNNAILDGTGVGQPLGILNSPSLISVAAEAGQLPDTVVIENVFKMWARLHPRSKSNAVWYINSNVTPQLYALGLTVGTGGMPMFMAPGSLPNAPSGALLGRPVVETEHNPTLGDVGDILLADLSQYAYIDKDVQAASSIHVQFLTDQVAYRFVYRCDGQPKMATVLTPFAGDTLSSFVALAAR